LQFLLNDKFIMANWLLHILQDKVNSVEIWCIWKICMKRVQNDSRSYIKMLT
jgi:hypothetical protein